MHGRWPGDRQWAQVGGLGPWHQHWIPPAEGGHRPASIEVRDRCGFWLRSCPPSSLYSWLLELLNGGGGARRRRAQDVISYVLAPVPSEHMASIQAAWGDEALQSELLWGRRGSSSSSSSCGSHDGS
jgi:hypothetical protein